MQQLRGTIYTIGYAHPDTAADVPRLMQQEHIILLDVRFSPRSRWKPTWNRAALQTTYGARYQWEKRLGNLNYQQRELGIELAEGHLDAAQEAAALLAAGTSLILLCACKDARTCHRTLVAKLVQDAVQALREVGR
jgi:uncharacterized protein (DUF488 family)